MEPVVSGILSVTTRGLCMFRKASELADQGYSFNRVGYVIDSDSLPAENQAVRGELDIA